MHRCDGELKLELTFPRIPDSSELQAGRFVGLYRPAVDQFAWGQGAERAVWTVMVVVVLPIPQFLPGIVQRDELVDIEELVAQLSIEGPDQATIRGLSGPGVPVAAKRVGRDSCKKPQKQA